MKVERPRKNGNGNEIWKQKRNFIKWKQKHNFFYRKWKKMEQRFPVGFRQYGLDVYANPTCQSHGLVKPDFQSGSFQN
jgi:hypothetical protein